MSVSETQIQGEDGRFRLRGELSFATVNRLLHESRNTLFLTSSSDIDLELRDVSRADSAGLALLLQWVRMANEDKRTIRFHHLPEQLISIAEVAEVSALLPIAE